MDNQFIWGIVALACGAFMMAYGASFFRFVLAFAGFYIGFTIGMMITAPSSAYQLMIAVVLGGIIGGLLFFFVKIALYAAGALMGVVLGLLVVAVFGWQDTTWGWLIALGGLGLGGFFGPRLGDWVLILASAFAGAYAVTMGVSMLLVDTSASADTGQIASTAAVFIIFLCFAGVSTLAQMQIMDLRRRIRR